MKHTQNFIVVRVEEYEQLIDEKTPSKLLENLSSDRLAQTVGLINGASDKTIKVSIIPRKN